MCREAKRNFWIQFDSGEKSPPTWVPILPLALTSCVALGGRLTLSRPQSLI